MSNWQGLDRDWQGKGENEKDWKRLKGVEETFEGLELGD